MAENENGQERTEEATPKKLLDSRKKGQVARSKELSTVAVTVAGAAGLIFMGPQLGEAMAAQLSRSFEPERLRVLDPQQLPGILYGDLLDGLLMFLPLMALLAVVAIASSAALGGWTFSLGFKMERLDPIKGLGKLFSSKSLVELAKAVGKLVFVGGSAAMLSWQLADDVLNLSLMPVADAIMLAAAMLSGFFLAVSLSLIGIAALDVPWQWFSHKRELKMTLQEVKDEQKETDGRPEVKSRIRQMQQQAAESRMMESVPDADVVITNPTHFAVAIQYDALGGGAPKVLAKGTEHMARRIREQAQLNDVPLAESPRLARAIYASTEVSAEIPEGLYLAVAQVLAWVYQLRHWEAQGGDKPPVPETEVDDVYLGNYAI